LSLASLTLRHLLLDIIQRIHQVVSVSPTFHLDSVSMRKRFIYHSFLFAISSTNLSSSKAPLLPHGMVSTSIHVACFSELHGSRVCSSRAASIMPCRVRHISGSRGLTGRQFNSSLTGKLPLHFGLLPIPLRRRGKSLDTPAKETETETGASRSSAAFLQGFHADRPPLSICLLARSFPQRTLCCNQSKEKSGQVKRDKALMD